MAQAKINATQKHKDGVQKAINLYGSRENLARYLEITQPNISQWLYGVSIIPIKYAEALANNRAKPMDFLVLRPDMLKFKKYFQRFFKGLQK